MEEVFEEAELDEWDSTEEVAEKLQEAFVEVLSGDDTVLTGSDEYQNTVTADDVARLIKLKQNAPESVTFRNVSQHSIDESSHPKEKLDTGRGEKDGYDSTTIYQITCPQCYGTGEVEVTHGWNSYFTCSHCGQNIVVSS